MHATQIILSFNLIASHSYLNNIAKHKIFSTQSQFLPLTDDSCELRDHVLEGFHNLGGLALLVVREDACHDHHSRQYDAKVQVVVRRFLYGTRLQCG